MQSVREAYISFASICKTLVGISTVVDFIPKMAKKFAGGYMEHAVEHVEN